MSVIPVSGSLRQENHEFEANLGYVKTKTFSNTVIKITTNSLSALEV